MYKCYGKLYQICVNIFILHKFRETFPTMKERAKSTTYKSKVCIKNLRLRK